MSDNNGYPPPGSNGTDGTDGSNDVRQNQGRPPVPPPPTTGDAAPYGQRPPVPAPPGSAGSTPPVPPPYGSVPTAPYGQPTQGFGHQFAAPTGQGYGAPGYGTQAYGTQGYGTQTPAPPYGEPPAAGNRRLVLLLVIGIAAVGLLVAAVLFFVNLLGTNTGGGTSDGPSDDTTTEATAETESDLNAPLVPVQRFFDALAAGDSRVATDQFATRPSGSLINDAVLEYSNELGKIEDLVLTVTDEDRFSADVTATFTIGDVDFIEDFMLINSSFDGDPEYEIVLGGSTYFGGSSTSQMLVNGVRVNDSGSALIGMYEVTAPSENFEIAGQSVFPITSSTYSLPLDTELVLSDAGLETYTTLVREAVEECLASDTLEAGCNLTASDDVSGGTVTDGTLVRTLSDTAADTLNALEPRIDWGTTIADSGYIGPVDVTASCVLDGAESECELWTAPYLAGARVDLAAEDPVVEWE